MVISVLTLLSIIGNQINKKLLDVKRTKDEIENVLYFLLSIIPPLVTIPPTFPLLF